QRVGFLPESPPKLKTAGNDPSAGSKGPRHPFLSHHRRLSMNPIHEAIEQAQAASTNFPVPILLDVTASLLTLDQMIIGNIHVDGWLKVNAYGLFIDSDRTPFQSLELGLPMNEIGYNYSIKVGNPGNLPQNL